MAGERWACARCGMKNAGTAGSCASCGLLRGSVVVPPSSASQVSGGASPADRGDRPASLPALPGAFALTAPFEVIGYARARLRQRGGRAAGRAILATAVGSPLVVGMLTWAMATGQEALFLPIGLIGPVVLGVAAGIAIPGVAGWVFGIIGAAVGGLVAGLGLWLGVASGQLDMGSGGPVGPLEVLVYVALMALLIPILMGAQLGVGVVIGSALAAMRARGA